MKATYYGHIKWIEDLVPMTMWIQETIGYDKHALWGVSHWGRKRQQFYGFAVNRESTHDVYSKRRIIVVTELKIVEWHSYKHLDWITMRRDDDKLYKFKEGDFKRLRIQDIEVMLLLLVQGKLTNLTDKERFAFNVSLRMFTRSIMIQRHVEDLQLGRRVEDLQLGVKIYQKKLNLTKPDSYRSDLKRKEAYTAYSNPSGFIYQNKDKKNRNLYMALVDAYESDKIILDIYKETDTLKRQRDDDADKDEEPSAGPDRGSKRRKEGKEPESASAPTETATRSTGQSTQGSRSRQASASDILNGFLNNRNHHLLIVIRIRLCQLSTKVDTLTSELLASPTYELMKGSCKSLIELEYHLEEVFKATTDQLDWVNPEGALSRKYTTSIMKTKAADYGHIKWIEDLRKEAYTAYSNLRGFIYQNKDKRNRLMRIDELHKFSDEMFTDVRTALDDRLKGIRMQYLPQSI
nr:hypothetical protein [Tanacetum cinerariifolium]